jgi:hypothetical protein
VDVDIAEIGGRARRLFEVFVARAEIGVGAEIGVRLVWRRLVAVAPQENPVGKVGKFGTGMRIDEIPGPGDREVKAVFREVRARRCRRKFANRSTRSIASWGAVEPARRKRIAWCQRTLSGRSP